MNDKTAQEILDALKSGEANRTAEAMKTLDKLLFTHYDESNKRKQGNEATQTLEYLRDKFLELCDSEKNEPRYTGLRGLNAIAISRVFDEKIPEMLGIFLRTILDDNGNIRFITANAIGYMRPSEIVEKKGRFTEPMYVDLYLTLQGMHDAQKDRKKKKSILQALEKLYCPYLENLMKERGYTPKYQWI